MNKKAIKILTEVKKRITSKPPSFAMQMLRTDCNGLIDDLPRKYCGTVCCVAGHINDIVGKDGIDAGIGDASKELFGSSSLYARCWKTKPLFFLSRWPEPFQSEFKRCRSMRGRAAIACRRIDHFIQTEK